MYYIEWGYKLFLPVLNYLSCVLNMQLEICIVCRFFLLYLRLSAFSNGESLDHLKRFQGKRSKPIQIFVDVSGIEPVTSGMWSRDANH